jgi:hypothetical protein
MSISPSFRVKTSEYNTSNLRDLAGSLFQAFSSICSSGAVINNLNVKNLTVTNLTGGSSGGSTSSIITFTGIQVSGSIFFNNTITNVSFNKTGKVVVLTIGYADNSNGVISSTPSQMDIFVPVITGGIPLTWIPSNIYNTGGQAGPTYIIPVQNGGAQYVSGKMIVNFSNRAGLDINIIPLNSSSFSGGEEATLYPTTVTYITDN